jgi:hypothetical protein
VVISEAVGIAVEDDDRRAAQEAVERCGGRCRMLGRTHRCVAYGELRRLRRYCQDLWIGVTQATSVSVDSPGSTGVMSVGRSSSLPLWNTAPARTRATRCGALTARQRACAASISL